MSNEDVAASKFRSGEEETRSYAWSEERSTGQLLVDSCLTWMFDNIVTMNRIFWLR